MVTDCATDVRGAFDRIASKREQMLAKQRAAKRFEHRVRKLAAQSTRPPAGTTQATTCGTASAAAATQRDDTADKDRRRVRELFAGTIRPHSVSDASESEPSAVTIRGEFGPEVATALSPDTGSRFTPAAKEVVVSATTEQRRDPDGTCRILDGEERSLWAALAMLDECEDWVAWMDETPFLELGFNALRRRHETLADHREACDQLVRERQWHLNGAAHHTAAVKAGHRFLATYLYENRATDYPVLAAATRVDDSCADCQRAAHDHLVRRV